MSLFLFVRLLERLAIFTTNDTLRFVADQNRRALHMRAARSPWMATTKVPPVLSSNTNLSPPRGRRSDVKKRFPEERVTRLPAGGRGGIGDQRTLPPARVPGGHLLPTEEQVRGDGCVRREEPQSSGGGDRAAECTAGKVDARDRGNRVRHFPQVTMTVQQFLLDQNMIAMLASVVPSSRGIT